MLELGKLLKGKLHENLVGTHISMTDSISSEILGQLGYDFIWIDSEHSENGYTSIRNHLTAVNAGGTPAVVRISRNDYNHVKRILEMGPQGVVFPMVNTAEEAEAVVRYVSYPPRGIRGFGPLRAVRYGLDDLGDYIAEIDGALSCFIQIESLEAVENLEEIVKIDRIDGYIFGPCDLSGTVGELNMVFNETTQSHIRRAIDILKRNNKPIGISLGTTDIKIQRFWHDLGINILSVGTDYDYILRGAKKNLEQVRSFMR
ncbi:MAG: aldolase [Clostridia bacterium]|nr:aldolase [Clostridia bacterium]